MTLRIPYTFRLCTICLLVGLATSTNHAVIVSSSRYWFNYRHAINALAVYKLLKDNGFPDDNIILMIADEYAVNDRNTFKNAMLHKGKEGPSLFDNATEIDYRGQDVTVENMVKAMLNTHSTLDLPVLRSDQHSKVLFYVTGHGGDEFFKFQDVEEILSADFGALFQQMHAIKKFQELLFIADTCQAFTLGDKIKTPNVTIIASSLRGESSYSHHSDQDVGLSVIERYTYGFLEEIEKYGMDRTLKEALVDPHTYKTMKANLGVDDSRAIRKLDRILVSDFFALEEVKVAKSGKVATRSLVGSTLSLQSDIQTSTDDVLVPRSKPTTIVNEDFLGEVAIDSTLLYVVGAFAFLVLSVSLSL